MTLAADTLRWLVAGTGGYLIYSLLDAFIFYFFDRIKQDYLLDFQDANQELEEIKVGSETYQVRAAFKSLSIDIAGHERIAILVSSLLVGGLLGSGLSLFLPGLFALPIGLGAGYFLVGSFIRSRWRKQQIALEKEIPTIMRNLSGILKTDASPIAALSKASQALQPEGPLKAWLGYLLDEVQAKGIGVLSRLQAEAGEISASLALCVFEIGRMAETGGGGYARAFKDAADNLALLLEVRAEAHSEVKGALGLAKLIIAIAAGIYIFLVTNPGGSVIFSTPTMKMMLAGSVAWGVFGWFWIQKMVQEAVR